MTDTPKGRHLFALSLIATIYSGPSGHIHNTVGCVMAYSVQDAIGKAWAEIYVEFPHTEGWIGHDVSVYRVDNVAWLTEALATETGRTGYHDITIPEPYPSYFAVKETP